MQIYNYHRTTGEYLGTRKARLDPLETKKQGKDVFLLPAHASFAAPPEATMNEKAIMKDGAWTTVPDFRGSEYYLETGEKVIITRLNEVIPEDALMEPSEPPPPTEDDLYEQKIVAEMRTMAIERLISKGELPTDYA